MLAFDPSCSLPSTDGVGYVSSCNVRGTFDILWGCLFTLIICTWTAQHLNVPRQYPENASQGVRDWVLMRARGLWQRMKWMIIALIAPEFLVGRAVQDWMMAWRSTQDEKMKEVAAADGMTWTIVHAFYANMGGFILTMGEEDERKLLTIPFAVPDFASANRPKADQLVPLQSPPPDRNASMRTTMLDAEKSKGPGAEPSFQPYPLATKGSEVPRNDLPKLHFHANARQLCLLRSWNLISRLPALSAREISDKSQSDSLVKITAVGQVLWLIIQTIARSVRPLPVTPLEIATLAFSACAFLTYVFSWYKPQGVQLGTFIGRMDRPSVRQWHELRAASGHSLFWHMTGFLREAWRRRETALFGPVRNDITFWDLEIRLPLGIRREVEHDISYTLLGTGVLFGSIVFGAIHCAAWDFQFPTDAEKVLWRVASVLSLGIMVIHPMVHTIMAVASMWIPALDDVNVVRRALHFATGVLTLAVVVGYVVSRLFLMVEVFRSLFYLPPLAFLSTWSSSVPHFG